MVVLQCNNNASSMKTSRSDGDLSLSEQTLGLGSLPARTRDSGVGASTSSDIEGLDTPSNLSHCENINSFSPSAEETCPLSNANTNSGILGSSSPSTPLVSAAKLTSRKPKTVNFRDDVDIVTVHSFADVHTVMEELANAPLDNQCKQCISEVKCAEVHVVDSCTLETAEIQTKFPNSFVATKRKKPLPRSYSSPLTLGFHSSMLSSISDSSVGSSITSVVSECDESMTSFKTQGAVDALPSIAFNRSLGHLFPRSSLSSISSASSQSSRSSSQTSAASVSLKTPSSTPIEHSPMLMSPSTSSLSSYSSHGMSSLDAYSPTEDPRAVSPPEVPEYAAVGASSCEKCPEGKCRTVYLHVPELPFGWEKVEDPHYGVYYIDHVNRRTQYENPVHTAKNKQVDNEVSSASNRQKSTPESGTKRSASDNNMNGQLTLTRRPFFTKNPEELKGEFTYTSLVKSVRGLGFTIVGGNYRDTQFLQIKNVVENGPAYLSGKLKTGDVLVRVNNTCVLGFTHQDVVRLFQSIAPGETVHLETCRGYSLNFDPDDPNTEIVTTVAVTLPQDAGTSNMSSTATTNTFLDSVSPHNLRAGMKSLPDLTRSVVGHGLNSTSSLSPSNSHDETGLHERGNHDEAIPDLVSLSINSRPEILTIPIVKGPMGFGFTIADSPYGQRVKQILDQARCKNLAEGDLLVMINSVNVSELPHQQTVQVLKECQQDKETIIVVQRGGIPPGKAKRQIKMSQSFDERQQQSETITGSRGQYIYQQQDNIVNEQLEESFVSNNDTDGDGDNVDRSIDSLPAPPEDMDEDIDDTDGGRLRSKTPSQDPPRPQRPKTPLEDGRAKTPTGKIGSPRQYGHLDGQTGRRDFREANDFSKFNSNHSRADFEAAGMGRPPPSGSNRSEFFPRFDPRVRSTDHRNDPFQKTYSSMQNHVGGGDDRWGYGREVKPGQFRSRTPGPELMTRGGPGPDSSRQDNHRPKTPTAADMRSNGKPASTSSVGAGDFRTSGRFTPNPSSEQGRQYRSPYQEYSRNWPDFSSPPPQRRYEPFENPSLNRSYAGEFPRPAFQNSVGPGRPMRQSTSFENELPAPSTITRVPRRPPPHPAFQDLSPDPRSRGIPEEVNGQVMEMVVTLHRQENGYGFRIIGGTEEGSQVSVGHIVPGGAADMDGRLRQYDEITHVDGCSVLNASHHRVVQLMTSAALNGRVTLSIRRVLGPGDSSTGQSISPQYPYDVVVSRRENEGFGFVIISSVNKSGASVDEYIGHIQENSPAARCGRLHVGDRILAVNGVDTSNMHHKDVVNLIKDSGFSVALTVGPPPDDSSGTPSQRSSQGSVVNNTPYPPDRTDMNIQSWERNHPGLPRETGRPRAPSNQGSDDSGEMYQVELYRGSRGFGFSIRGGREFNSMPLFVLRIAEGGAADLDGRLRVGDQILEVNGFNTDNMTHTEAIEIIQNGGPSVKLLMRRTNKPPPVFDMPPTSPRDLVPPNIQMVANGPISHSSPHLARRQLQQHQQPLPPPPPDLQPASNDNYFHGYPPPPMQTSQQQRLRFNNY